MQTLLDITMLLPKKSILALTTIFLALAVQTSAHAIPKRVYLLYASYCNVNGPTFFQPHLGVKGTPKQSNVQRPSTAKLCRILDIVSNLDASTAIAAAADGTVTMKVQNCSVIVQD
jgi:hypothetical protein